MKIIKKTKIVDKNFKTVFDNVAQLKLSSKYKINSGGCGWFAYFLAKQFPNLKIYYQHPDDIRALKKGQGSACNHVLLWDGKRYYDSNGVYTGYINKGELVEVSIAYLRKSLKTNNVWNTTFDTNKVEIIEKKILKVVN